MYLMKLYGVGPWNPTLDPQVVWISNDAVVHSLEKPLKTNTGSTG